MTTLKPDITPMLLPHFSGRLGKKINTIVVHYPGPNLDHEKPYSPLAIHAKLLSIRLSYHYYVGKDGAIYQFVLDKYKAWHAGISNLHGDQNLNTCSIGLCLENNGGERYPKEQLEGAAKLVRYLRSKYEIPLNRVVGHNHCSPDRKRDPGKYFPWATWLDQCAVLE